LLTWSYAAQCRPPLAGCTTHINCANCPCYAYRRHEAHIARILSGRPSTYLQPPLFDTREVA
jgi:hypothetical protein